MNHKPDCKTVDPDPEQLAKQSGYQSRLLIDCFIAGFGSIMHGSNQNNSHFTIFSTAEKTKAWETGRDCANKIKNHG